MIPTASPPILDGHREQIDATIRTAAIFYRALFRIGPEAPSSAAGLVRDVFTAAPKPTDDGKSYTVNIRNDVPFHNGETVTAADVAAERHGAQRPSEARGRDSAQGR